jgi:hypothetical protein
MTSQPSLQENLTGHTTTTTGDKDIVSGLTSNNIAGGSGYNPPHLIENTGMGTTGSIGSIGTMNVDSPQPIDGHQIGSVMGQDTAVDSTLKKDI